MVDYLRSAGIGADEIVWEGRGENEPRYPNDSEENRSRNRRVEIMFVTEQARTGQIRISPDGPITGVRQTEMPAASANSMRSAGKQPGQGGLAVQVGSFSVEANANRLVNQLKAMNYEAYVFRTESHAQAIWLVRIRVADGREAATALQEQLREETGLDSLIVTQSA